MSVTSYKKRSEFKLPKAIEDVLKSKDGWNINWSKNSRALFLALYDQGRQDKYRPDLMVTDWHTKDIVEDFLS